MICELGLTLKGRVEPISVQVFAMDRWPDGRISSGTWNFYDHMLALKLPFRTIREIGEKWAMTFPKGAST